MKNQTVEKLYHLVDVVGYEDHFLMHSSDRILEDGWCHTEINSKNWILVSMSEVIDSLKEFRLYNSQVSNVLQQGMSALRCEDVHHFKIEFKDGLLTKAVSVEYDDFVIETSLL